MLGRHDVEAEEAKVAVVPDDGDGCGGLAVEVADQEACRIGGMEGREIAQPWVPPFAGRPFDRDGKLITRCLAYVQFGHDVTLSMSIRA